MENLKNLKWKVMHSTPRCQLCWPMSWESSLTENKCRTKSLLEFECSSFSINSQLRKLKKDIPKIEAWNKTTSQLTTQPTSTLENRCRRSDLPLSLSLQHHHQRAHLAAKTSDLPPLIAFAPSNLPILLAKMLQQILLHKDTLALLFTPTEPNRRRPPGSKQQLSA